MASRSKEGGDASWRSLRLPRFDGLLRLGADRSSNKAKKSGGRLSAYGGLRDKDGGKPHHKCQQGHCRSPLTASKAGCRPPLRVRRAAGGRLSLCPWILASWIQMMMTASPSGRGWRGCLGCWNGSECRCQSQRCLRRRVDRSWRARDPDERWRTRERGRMSLKRGPVMAPGER